MASTPRAPARLAAALSAALALVLLIPGPAPAQAGFERIVNLRVDLAIGRDGALTVSERIAYDFGPLQRHGILRDIPVRLRFDDRFDRVYPLEVLSVEGSPGTPDQFKLEKAGNQLRIRIGDPDRTITGRHVYTIRYRVEGAMNGFEDHDELFWNAVGTNWTVLIERATVRLSAPVALEQIACFAGPEGSRLPCAESELRGSAATYRHEFLGPYSGLTVVAALPRGVVPDPQPVLDERWDFLRAFSVTPVSVGGSLAILVLGLAVLAWMLWSQGRDRRAVGSALDIVHAADPDAEQAVPLFESSRIPVEFAPPDGLKPGQVGTLIDEVAHPLDMTATIVDLAVRGYLRIEEIPKKWLFGKGDYQLVLLREADEHLEKYERLLLNGLFSGVLRGNRGLSEAIENEDAEAILTEIAAMVTGAVGAEATAGTEPAAGAETTPPRPDVRPAAARPALPEGIASVQLSKLQKKFAPRLQQVQDALYADAARRRWFVGRPDKVRLRWAGWGFLLFVAGVALTALAAWLTHLGLVPVPVAILGLVLAFSARHMPRRTAKGTGLVRRVLGFRRYIETAEAQELRFHEDQSIFSRYLPYAVVFGLTERWTAAFAGLADQLPETTWYVGTTSHLDFAAFSSSIDGFSSTAASTITSTPGGSGSSGFSGGGSSGGGGGGGGGGSW